MDMMKPGQDWVTWHGLPILALLLLICFLFLSMAFAEDTKTYRNHYYKYTLNYPWMYTLKNVGRLGFDLIRAGRIIVQGNIEDVTFRIFIKKKRTKRISF